MKRISAGLIVALGLTLGATANGDPWPHRKPGLWQMTLTMKDSKMPPMTSKYCIDLATESALMNLGKGAVNKMCSKQDIHMSGGAGTVDMVCKFGHSTQTSHTAMSFSGDTTYHSETHAHMEPALFGKSDHTTINDAKWVGPCPADMKPGDIIMANGMKMHMDPNAH